MHVPYCHLWPVWLYAIFTNYLINDKIFKNKFAEHTKRVLISCTTFFWNIFRSIERDMIKNVDRSLCQVPFILVRFWLNLNFLHRVSKNTQISDFMKIPPMEGQLFHTDEGKDGRTLRSRIFSTEFRKILTYQISWKSLQWKANCSITTKGRTDGHYEVEFSPQSFEKNSNIRFHKNPSNGRPVVPYRRREGRTDITKSRIAFHNFVNAPKDRPVPKSLTP